MEAVIGHKVKAVGDVAVTVITEEVVHPLGVVLTAAYDTLVPVLPTFAEVQLQAVQGQDTQLFTGCKTLGDRERHQGRGHRLRQPWP